MKTTPSEFVHVVCHSNTDFSVLRYLCTDSEQDLQKLMAALVKAKVSFQTFQPLHAVILLFPLLLSPLPPSLTAILQYGPEGLQTPLLPTRPPPPELAVRRVSLNLGAIAFLMSEHKQDYNNGHELLQCKAKLLNVMFLDVCVV